MTVNTGLHLDTASSDNFFGTGRDLLTAKYLQSRLLPGFYSLQFCMSKLLIMVVALVWPKI